MTSRRHLTSADISQPNVTGINRWWTYEEGTIPGVGHYMVNLASANLLLQGDDMDAQYRGINLALRRTYNSFSGHDYVSTDGSTEIGQYGNGWTNSLDAHMSTNNCSTGGYSIYDIDGARYDYCYNTSGTLVPPPGLEGTTLTTPDGSSFFWTKKSGTVYTFYAPYFGGTMAGFAGRIGTIYAHNNNNYITFAYAWSPDASSSTNLRSITVTTDSGLSALLTFQNFAGRWLLGSLTRPDQTVVTYQYDANGNLVAVNKPGNNSTATLTETYSGYQSLLYVSSPRWVASTANNDGGYATFFYVRGSTTEIAGVRLSGVMNFTPNDGTNTLLQPNVSQGPMDYLYIAIDASSPEYTTTSDTDGRQGYYYIDGFGRESGAQQYTGTLWLEGEQGWDSHNNLIMEVNPRGYETDYAYDANDNTIAVAEPSTATSQGTFRPTTLLDYDAFNNMTAYCDPTETHQAGADWTSAPPSSDSLCSSRVGSIPHARFTYSYPSYAPVGRLESIIKPLGYTERFSYQQPPSVDYGLPISVTGDAITQLDGSVLAPSQTFWYDSSGRLRCYNSGQGTWVLSTDVMGRVTMVADPDDSSANAASICNKTSGRGWNTQTVKTYNADGTLLSSQSPAEAAAGVSTTYSYDADQNLKTETTHFGCTSNPCTAGVVSKWYDGADRLVDVALPHDPSDYYAFPFLTRYIYDLSSQGGASLTIGNSSGVSAHGHLYKTQEWIGPQIATSPSVTPSWQDVRGESYDAFDRAISRYEVGLGGIIATNTYDVSNVYGSLPGLLGSSTNAAHQSSDFAYDPSGRIVATTFGGTPATPAKSITYDPNGRLVVSNTANFGDENRRYDADGNLVEDDEPTGGTLTTPSKLTYGYYGDGHRSSVSIANSLSGYQAFQLLQYDYRADGALAKTHLNYPNASGDFVKTYTDAGRFLTATDPLTGTAAPYPSLSSTFQPRTSSYDGFGRIYGYQLPTGAYYFAFAFDFEGEITNYRAYTNGTLGGFAPQITYNSRGESTMQVIGNGCGGDDFSSSAKSANGYLVPGSTCGQILTQSFNAYLDLPISRSTASSRAPRAKSTTSASYDAAGRLSTETKNLTYVDTSTSPSTNVPCNGSATRTYDAQNRIIGLSYTNYTFDIDASQAAANAQCTTNTGSATYAWGPNGHPLNMGAISVHWDGDSPLFTTDTQGNVLSVMVAQAAIVLPNNSQQPLLTVFDRDWSGMMVNFHRSNWAPSAQPPSLYGGTNTAAAASSYGGSFDSFAYDSELAQPSTDGLWDGRVVIQGARSYDSSLGTWTTPDAYAGIVHDPMSQRPYMWNRNNPYQYRDPSGFDAYVILDPAAVRGLGHLMIAVIDHATGVGLLWSQGPAHDGYPHDVQVITMKVVTLADLAKLVKTGSEIVMERTTHAQDYAMNTKAAALQAKQNVNFNGVTCNCDQFVKDVLGTADGRAASVLHIVPRTDFDALTVQGYSATHKGESPAGFQPWDPGTTSFVLPLGWSINVDSPMTGDMGDPANGSPVIQPHTHL